MNKALHSQVVKPVQTDWRKKMSNNVAYGLLVYTALQIFVTMHELQERSASILPVFVLVILVAAIIPMFRHFERRWEHLTDDQAHDPAFAAAFKRDQIKVWVLAGVLPFVITGGFKVLAALF
ncbi:MAG: hypothetical protein ACO1OX_09280 [Novosphingobium sp.]